MKGTLLLLAFIALNAWGQDIVPSESLSGNSVLGDSVVIKKSGLQHGRNTYMEIYDVITDSVVYRFGIRFKCSDSSFVGRVPLENYSRKFYDELHETTEHTLHEQERLRKETIDFLHRYKTSTEIWVLFKLYGLLK